MKIGMLVAVEMDAVFKKYGDTLTKISIKNYGNAKRVKEICELNQIQENDLIYPGQTILLP